jgi:hypothetical protein
VEYTQILKQAWHTAWRYRALWILGILLALTATSWSVPVWYGRSKDDSDGGRLVYVLPDDSRIIIPGSDAAGTEPGTGGERKEDGDLILNYKGQANGWPVQQGDVVISYAPPDEFSVAVAAADRNGQVDLKTLEIWPGTVGAIIALGIGLIVLLGLLFVVSRIARYVAETALIRMVGEYEETGERRGVWQGLRAGWSRSAWRLFLIDLLVNIVGVLAGILLFTAILAPLPLWVQGSEAVIFTLAFLTGSLFFLAIALLVVGSAALSLFKRIAWRACAVEGLGVFGSIGRAYRVIRGHFKDVGLLWLIALAVRWAWRLALVPIVLGLLGVALLTGSLPALLTGGLASLVSSGDLPVFLALGVGIPVFAVVLLMPLLLLAGLREVFVSALWTLSYRKMRSSEDAATQPAPDRDVPGLESAPVPV